MRWALMLMIFVFAALLWQRGDDRRPQAAQPEEKLPGARAVIDAAAFASLQAALDALPAEGGVVQLPPGKFQISSPLRISVGDVCLRGAGTATHIENTNEQGQPALVLAHPDSKLEGPQRDAQLWRIRLADFRLTGNPKSGAGIAAYNINEIFLDGMTVSHHGGDGILLDHCYEDPRVSDCLITYNRGTGLNLLGCHDIVVAANQFEENQDAVHCMDGYNLCMTGNNVDDHLGRGVVIENTYGSVVSGNMIEECAAEAVVLDRDCYGITISANVIAHNGGGIDLRDAHGCAVSANTLTIMKEKALRLGPKSSRIAVSGNCFSNSYIGDGQLRRGTNDLLAAGVVLEGARDSSINGNVFSGVQPFAVQQSDAAGILFHGNLLVESASQHAELQESQVSDNLERP